MELQKKYHEIKSNFLQIIEEFEKEYDEYVDTYSFLKFEKRDNDSTLNNFKRSETVFDKNHETIIRNNKLIEKDEIINNKLNEFIKVFEDIQKQIKDENESIIHYNNQLINEMKEFEENVKNEEIKKRRLGNRIHETKYQYNMKYSYDQFIYETFNEKKQREIEEEARLKEQERFNEKVKIENEKRKEEQKIENERLKELEIQRKRKERENFIQSFFINSKNIAREMHHQYVTLIKMEKSNIKFENLNELIVSDKTKLDFFDDYNNKPFIPVNCVTKGLICIGSLIKGQTIIHLEQREDCEKYEIRFEPQTISLKQGEACEISLYLKSLCSCKVDDYFIINIFNCSTKKHTEYQFKMYFETEKSSMIDPDDLTIEKHLGDGFFWKCERGVYKTNKVSIRKFKGLDNDNNSGILKDFEKEVSMLEKFRNDFIIGFVGWVVIGRISIRIGLLFNRFNFVFFNKNIFRTKSSLYPLFLSIFNSSIDVFTNDAKSR